MVDREVYITAQQVVDVLKLRGIGNVFGVIDIVVLKKDDEELVGVLAKEYTKAIEHNVPTTCGGHSIYIVIGRSDN